MKRNERNKMGKIMKGAERIDPDALYENIKKIPREKNKNDIVFIINCLRNHFVFYNLSEHELYIVFYFSSLKGVEKIL